MSDMSQLLLIFTSFNQFCQISIEPVEYINKQNGTNDIKRTNVTPIRIQTLEQPLTRLVLRHIVLYILLPNVRCIWPNVLEVIIFCSLLVRKLFNICSIELYL